MTHTPAPLPRSTFWQDTHPSAVISGFVATLVSWAGPVVLIYSVGASAHLDQATMYSWVWASTVICGLLSIGLSLRTRTPILSTWSTPGIAFLVTALPGIPFTEAVGAFVISALLVTLLGSIRQLTGLLTRIPTPLAAALNAAILLPFGFHLLQALGQRPALVGSMVAAYFVLRHLSPRWAVAGVLLVGIIASVVLGLWTPGSVPLSPTLPEVFTPQFSWRATLNLALPLTLLAFTGQFVPGFAVLGVNGYKPDAGLVLRWCGIGSVLAGLLGCQNLTLGALLANVVSGPEAHPDPQKRYTAAVYAGGFNILFGLFTATFLHLMALLPAQALAAVAGLALLSAMGSNLSAAFVGSKSGALGPTVILLITLSGLNFFGIGSAFWGILAGLAVYGLEGYFERRAALLP